MIKKKINGLDVQMDTRNQFIEISYMNYENKLILEEENALELIKIINSKKSIESKFDFIIENYGPELSAF